MTPALLIPSATEQAFPPVPSEPRSVIPPGPHDTACSEYEFGGRDEPTTTPLSLRPPTQLSPPPRDGRSVSFPDCHRNARAGTPCQPAARPASFTAATSVGGSCGMPRSFMAPFQKKTPELVLERPTTKLPFALIPLALLEATCGPRSMSAYLSGTKLPETAVSNTIGKVQVVPTHAPVQPANLESALGLAVSLTWVPW